MNPLVHSPVSGSMQFSHLTPVQEAAITSFGNNLEYCKDLLPSGEPIELPGNVETRFGSEMAATYFAYQLGFELGRNVAVYTGSDGLHTVVRFAPEQDMRAPAFPLSLEPSSFTSTSTEQPATTSHTASSIRKGPPRPMNCWMLYRDTRHKQLKDQFPHLTVQQISTLCSEGWKNLSPAEKDEWRVRAKDAKEEHQRMYPDYKYTPRKPGEKKKRQSRKAAQAAMAATAPANITGQGEIHLPSSSVVSAMPLPPNEDFRTASDDMSSNINDSLFGVAGQPIEADNASSQQGLSFHNDEMVRQDLLDFEFGSSFDFDYLVFGDDDCAFRYGADASATLPAFTTDMF